MTDRIVPEATVYHIHHIIPKHMGGTDDPLNLIKLTIEEHIEAHKKLYEQYGKIEDKLAYMMLQHNFDDETFQECLKEWGRKGGLSRKGFKLSESHKKNIGLGHLGSKSPRTSIQNVKYKSREFLVTNPKGVTMKIRNLRKFCRENDLHQGCMSNVAAGRTKNHRGWTCIHVDQS